MTDESPIRQIKSYDLSATCNNRLFRKYMKQMVDKNPDCGVCKQIAHLMGEYQDDYLFRLWTLDRFDLLSKEELFDDCLTLYGRIQNGQKAVDIGLFEQCEGE